MKEIPEFKAGDAYTPLSSLRMNPIVRVLNALQRLTVVRGSKDCLHVSDANAVLELKRTTAAEAAATAGAAMFKVQSSGTNYLVCKEWDGTTEGDTVNVALPWTLRVDEAPSGSHVIWPAFEASDVILAIPVENSGVSAALEWVALAGGRFWALELEVCDGALTKTAYFHCSDPT